MTNYKMQYWLYAILNKLHGSEVRMERDVLHSQFAVNRHGFRVTTNTMPLRVVQDNLTKALLAGGYQVVQGGIQSSDNKTLTKAVGGERRYVSISWVRHMNSSKVSLDVQGSIYKGF